MISINGTPGTPLVSVDALAQWLGDRPALVEAELREANVLTTQHAGGAWAPTSHPHVSALLRESGVGDVKLFTPAGAIASLGMSSSEVRSAAAVLQARFATEQLAGLHTEEQLRAPIAPARAARSQPAAGASELRRPARPARTTGGAVARAPRPTRTPQPTPPLLSPAARESLAATARGTARLGRVGLPYAAGAVPAMYAVSRLAGSAGDPLDPVQHQRARRAGVLVGGSIIGIGGGLAVARAIAPDLPRTALVARGVALGGAALGALALNGLHAVSGSTEGS